MVADALWDMQYLPEMFGAAERILGPYPVGRYDVLVMPPAFVAGGMENPMLNFLAPGGVVNVLTGFAKEMLPHLAKHREVIALDVWSEDTELRAMSEREGSANVKRVRTHATAPLMDEEAQGIGWIERFLEMTTVWHPVGV